MNGTRNGTPQRHPTVGTPIPFKIRVPLRCHCGAVAGAVRSQVFTQVSRGRVPLVPLKTGLWNSTRERNGHNPPCKCYTRYKRGLRCTNGTHGTRRGQR